MNREELMTLLPHRDGMLLLDQLDKEGEMAHGQYHVRGDEWFCRRPSDAHGSSPAVISTTRKSTVFRPNQALDEIPSHQRQTSLHAGVPGNQWETKCRITRAKHPFYFAEGEGYVGDTLCVKAEFSFGITEKAICFQRS